MGRLGRVLSSAAKVQFSASLHRPDKILSRCFHAGNAKISACQACQNARHGGEWVTITRSGDVVPRHDSCRRRLPQKRVGCKDRLRIASTGNLCRESRSERRGRSVNHGVIFGRPCNASNPIWQAVNSPPAAQIWPDTIAPIFLPFVCQLDVVGVRQMSSRKIKRAANQRVRQWQTLFLESMWLHTQSQSVTCHPTHR